MSHQLVLTVVDDVEGHFTECTVKISKELQVNSGPIPQYARLGDGWIALDNIGDFPGAYSDLSSEGLAMKFLRLAWYAAHDEIEQTNKPFDGDPNSTIEKAIKDAV